MPRVSLTDVEDALLENDDPVVTAPELAEDLPATRRHIAERLDLLERDGPIHTKKVGGRARVYWHEQRVTGPRPPEEHPGQSDLDETAQPADGSDGALEYDVIGATREYLRDEKPAWTERQRDEAAEAVEAAIEFLREREQAQKRHFLENVRPNHPAGFPVRDDEESEDRRDRSGWWRHVVRPMLKEHPDVEVRGGWYHWIE